MKFLQATLLLSGLFTVTEAIKGERHLGKGKKDDQECSKEFRIDPCLNGGNCTKVMIPKEDKRRLHSKDEEESFECTCPPGWTGDTCQDKACLFGEYFDMDTNTCSPCQSCDTEGAIITGGCDGSSTEDDRTCSCKQGYYNMHDDDTNKWTHCERCACRAGTPLCEGDVGTVGDIDLGQYIDKSTCMGDGIGADSYQCFECGQEDALCKTDGLPVNQTCDGYGYADIADCQCFPFSSKITLCNGDDPSEGTYETQFSNLVTGQKALCYKHAVDQYHDGPGLPDCCPITSFTHLERKTNPYRKLTYTSPTQAGPDRVLALSSDHLMFKVHPNKTYSPDQDDFFSYTDTRDATAEEINVGDKIVAFVPSTRQTVSVTVTQKALEQEYGMVVAQPLHGEALVVDGIVVNAYKVQYYDDNDFPAEDYRHDFKRYQRAFNWMRYNETEDAGISLDNSSEVFPNNATFSGYLKLYRRKIRRVESTGNSTIEEKSDLFCKLAHEMVYTNSTIPSPDDLADFYKAAMALNTTM